jgi:hypothetical protein
MHNKLPAKHCAYQPLHSTECAAISLHSYLVCSFDRGCITAFVLLDLSSASDIVDHASIFSILSDCFSVHDSALHWFHFYVSHRTQSFFSSGLLSATFQTSAVFLKMRFLGALEFITKRKMWFRCLRSAECPTHYVILCVSSSLNEWQRIRNCVILLSRQPA